MWGVGFVVRTGLGALLGFLHEDKAVTTPLVYDFQEPYRWLELGIGKSTLHYLR